MSYAITIESEPFHTFPYLFPQTGGRAHAGEFSVYSGTAEWLPMELDGLLITSDLQGVEPGSGGCDEARLIGHILAEDMYLLSDSEKIPKAHLTGVILAGDLFVAGNLGKRGGKGDVRDVWRSFQSYFRWVVGVAGNHDRFGNGLEDLKQFAAMERIHYLDGDTIYLDSMHIGGVSGIIGNARKPFRRSEHEYLNILRSVVEQQPSLLILHESPEIAEVSYRGSVSLRDCLERLPPLLLICGHRNWDYPGLWTLKNGTQILNVEGRAVLLRRTIETKGDQK